MTTPVILDMGCGRRKNPSAIGVDNVALETVDVVSSLLSFPYPFASGIADEIIFSHVLEHFAFPDILKVLDESSRILKPTGCVTISVPHAMCVAFNTDPTHKTRFTFETLYYLTPEHPFSYYEELHSNWRVERLWASVNLVNNLHVSPTWWQQKLEGYASRIMRYLVRHSRSQTLPDLVVKTFPLWLVSIHCRLTRTSQ